MQENLCYILYSFVLFKLGVYQIKALGQFLEECIHCTTLRVCFVCCKGIGTSDLFTQGAVAILVHPRKKMSQQVLVHVELIK